MSKTTILIVEDEMVVAADLANKLDQLGYQIDGSTASGEEAVALARDRRPDLVLMDVHLMGPMDGVDAAERIRRECDIPVIYLTAHSDRVTLQRAKLTEPFGYILKPFEDLELETHIQMALYKHQAEHKLRESEQRWATTLASIGDAVIATDVTGRITFMNAVAETLTGWTLPEASQKPVKEVFRIIDEKTRREVEDPVAKVLRERTIVSLANHTLLVRKDGTEMAIDDSGAPIRVGDGKTLGVVLIFRDITEIRRAQESEKEALTVAASARTAIDAMEAMGEGVLVMDMTGRILSVNAALEHMSGYEESEVQGRSLEEMLSKTVVEEERPRALKELVTALNGETALLKPFTMIAKHGQSFPVIPAVSFIRNQDGKPRAIVVTLRDISELRAMYRALEESNILLERIFNNTHIQIAYLDTEFNFVRVNRAYAEAAGREPVFFIGKNLFVLHPQPDNEAIFRGMLQTGEMYEVHENSFKYLNQPPRGARWQDWSVQPVKNEQGRPEGVLLCLLDVTERVQARRKLVESERKYRELVENANSIIVRITPQHEITFINEYAEKFFGYEENEVLGRNVVGTIMPPVDSSGRDMDELMRAVTLKPDAHAYSENENMCKDGRRVWVHWTYRAVRDARGHVCEILCVGMDFTEHKRMEAEMEIYQQGLRALTERLSSTEERERRRLSTQIHDTVIQTLSLSNIKLGELRKQLVDAGSGMTVEQVNGIRTLIEDAIVESRSLMSELTPPLLYELGLVPALTDLMEKLRKRYGVFIRINDDAQPKPVDKALQGALFEATRELILNAVKHAGECSITASLSREGDRLCIRVLDNGSGFNVPQGGLFVFHTHGGFGLFAIRERIEGIGGSLDIQSEPGKGTAATISVPLSKEEA